LCLSSDLPQRVHATFDAHSLADFLFYGLYRTDQFGLGVPLDLSEIPPADAVGHFPQYVALRGATSPAELPALVEDYYGEELARYDIRLDELRLRILALRPRFEAYVPFWEERVQPLENRLLANWRRQLRAGHTFDLLQQVTRLRWPFPRIQLFACYHHPSGSALTPYPCLFSTLFDSTAVEPSLAWFLGHEALHLLLDAVAWWEHPDAPAAIRWLGSRHLAEEALCLVLQNRLAILSGVLPESEMQVLRGSAKYLVVYRWLQDHWEEYRTDAARFPTLVEYFLTGLREARESRRRSRRKYEHHASVARAA
jgi:hypothetical protein